MSNANRGLNCAAGCWLVAAGAGLVALVLMLLLGNIGFIEALFLAGAIFVVLGLFFGLLLCRKPAAPPGAERSGAVRPRESAAPAPEPAPAPAPTLAPTAQVTKRETQPETSATAGPAVESGCQLPGQEELAARKGQWRYHGAAAPAAPASGGATGPKGLARARGGRPDDLKRIRGVGPKLEKLLNAMGVFHFDQIAAWGPDEVAWVDQNLKGFKGRVSRDAWVAQAKLLAAGGETEFSRRVRDGDVYE